MTPTTAAADCIRAAGFDQLAREYEQKPAFRALILSNGMLRRAMVRKLGEAKAARFYALAERAA